MFFNLRVTYLNDYVKITSVKLKGVSDKATATKLSKEINKNKANLVRAKNTITDIALANDFQYFFTLTFNTSFDRNNLDQLRREWKKSLRLIKETFHIDLKYLIVPEQHKKGGWHFHGFLTKEIEKAFSYNEYGYQVVELLQRLGFHNFQKIQKRERIASYITKYVSKNLANGIDGFKHSYFASLGLDRGRSDIDLIYNNEYFNQRFFEYGNDFCYRKIMTKKDFEKIKPFLLTL